jgi:hypothetical protein
MKRLLLLISALGPIGCATTLTPAGSRVRLTTNADIVRDCEFIGDVAGNSTTWSQSIAAAGGNYYAQPGALDIYNSEVELRNRAGAVGANVVYLNMRDQYRIVGEAYFCRRRPAAAAAPGTPAARVQQVGIAAYVHELFDELASRGGDFSGLSDANTRKAFFDYLVELNPLTDQLTLEFVRRQWFAFRRGTPWRCSSPCAR